MVECTTDICAIYKCLIVPNFKEIVVHLINGWMMDRWMSGGESDLSLSLPTGNVFLLTYLLLLSIYQ